ncbi:hypothetical protein [Jeotgalibacillus proteolyticus]|uniref:Uncharacterized protein n=1 Tax=Jeotgalibacillus proteolyticus TaxID=2082395 RepID=A0A2S5GG56_9BACL|nr:hypothetical protein [Jeotgalibacillus proteolyticus]PPA71895.1 hypothetical protein C4B60_00505 [Jeotgalibacillus proteolyticus]
MFTENEIITSIENKIPLLLNQYPSIRSIALYKREIDSYIVGFGYECQDYERTFQIYRKFKLTNKGYRFESDYIVSYEAGGSRGFSQGSRSFAEAYEVFKDFPSGTAYMSSKTGFFLEE